MKLPLTSLRGATALAALCLPACRTELTKLTTITVKEVDSLSPTAVVASAGGRRLYMAFAAMGQIGVFDRNDDHGQTSRLTPAQLDDLVEFVLSL